MKPKFRAWDKKNKCFDNDLWLDFYGGIFDYPDKTYDTPNHEIILADKDRYELMQYTGLHDCQGKEIWEGDIIEYFTYMTPKGTDTRRRQTVTWNEWHWEGIRNWKQSEVIGNIYEHSGLLDGKDTYGD